MKQLFAYIAASLALTACTSTDLDAPTGEVSSDGTGMLSIRNIGLTIDTKAIYNGVAESGANKLSSIGVIVTKGATTEKDLYLSTVKSQNFTYSASSWTPNVQLPLTTTEGTLYAWAPSSLTGSMTKGAVAPTVADTEIKAAQTYEYNTTKADNELTTDQVDYLYAIYASPTVNRKNNVVATLAMQHALAKVSFRVMKVKDQTVSATEDFVKKITLTAGAASFVTSAATGATMSLADGTFTGTTTATDLTFTADKTWGQVATYVDKAGTANFDGVLAQAFGLVAPVTSVAEIKITLTLGTGDAQTTSDCTYASAANALKNVTWEKGKHYIYQLTVTDRNVSITSVTVVDWATGSTTNIPVV